MKISKLATAIIGCMFMTTGYSEDISNSKPNDYGKMPIIQTKLFAKAGSIKTKTPIKHLIVIFQGVVSLLQTLWLKGILGVSVANWHT